MMIYFNYLKCLPAVQVEPPETDYPHLSVQIEMINE